MRTPVFKLALLLPSLLLVGCKAGPSAFDRSGSDASAQVRPGPRRDTAAGSGPVQASKATGSRARSEHDAVVPVRDPTELRGDVGPSAGPSPEVAVRSPEESAPHPAEQADPSSERPLHFDQPKHVRGLYLNAWVAGSSRRLDDLLALARRTEINTFVIDIKDATGYVSYSTKVRLAVDAGATDQVRIHDLRGLLVKLKEAGIYPIARIVVIKDPVLVKYRPDLAVQDTAGGVWVDDKGIVWLNLFDEEVWRYHVALAEDVASYGFPEIQWDYVRFPDAPKSDLARAVFPDSAGISKPQAIRDFLEYSRKALAKKGVRVTADVFGVTASASGDVGIGQVWKSFIGAVDVAMPMVYPSHYWEGSFGFQVPNAHPYEVVHHALTDALRQSSEVKGAGATRPWLQDFTLGKPPYGAPEVRAEIQATYDAGIHDWILWNPSSHYTETALQPVGGFRTEPHIRVDGEIVPISERFDALAREAARTDSAPARVDTVPAETGMSRDTTGTSADTMLVPLDTGERSPDSVAGDTDSVAARADSGSIGGAVAPLDSAMARSDTLRAPAR